MRAPKTVIARCARAARDWRRRCVRGWARSSSRASTRARSRSRCCACRASRSRRACVARRASRRVLREFPEVVTVVSKTGRAEIATDPMGVELSDAIVMLKPHDRMDARRRRARSSSRRCPRAWRRRCPGLGFSFSQPIELRMAELISGTRSDVAITIYGDDLATLERLEPADSGRRARDVRARRDVRGEQLAGLADARGDRRSRRRRRATAFRCATRSTRSRRSVAAAWARSTKASDASGCRFEFRRRCVTTSTRSGHLPVSGASGPLVPLGQIASIQIVDSPASVSREAVRRRTNVEVNVRGRDLASLRRAKHRHACEPGRSCPPGYVVAWGGQFENLSAASRAPGPRGAARARTHLRPALHGVRSLKARAAHLPERAVRCGRRRVLRAARQCRSRSARPSASSRSSASPC